MSRGDHCRQAIYPPAADNSSAGSTHSVAGVSSMFDAQFQRIIDTEPASIRPA